MTGFGSSHRVHRTARPLGPSVTHSRYVWTVWTPSSTPIEPPPGRRPISPPIGDPSCLHPGRPSRPPRRPCLGRTRRHRLPVLPRRPCAGSGSTGLVINEVYVNGGSTARVLQAEFVELYNPTEHDHLGRIRLTVPVPGRDRECMRECTRRLPNVTMPSDGHYLIRRTPRARTARPCRPLTRWAISPIDGGSPVVTSSSASTEHLRDGEPHHGRGIIDMVGAATATSLRPR